MLLVLYVSCLCFMLLAQACEMVAQRRNCSSSSVHQQTADRTLANLESRAFMGAVAAAVRSVVATVALANSQAGQRELHGSTATAITTAHDLLGLCLEVAGQTAAAVSGYLVILVEVLDRVLDCTMSNVGANGAPPAPLQLPPETVRSLEALADSELLAAAATALVDSPDITTLPGVDATVRFQVCCKLQGACQLAGVGLWHMR